MSYNLYLKRTQKVDTFRAITRRDDLDRTIAGIDAALAAGLDPVKIKVWHQRSRTMNGCTRPSKTRNSLLNFSMQPVK